MGKTTGDSNSAPESLSEAISRLEAVGQSANRDLKERLGTDYQKVKEALDLLTPHVEDLKRTAENKAGEAKREVEDQIKQNPWLILGVVGLLAFVIGWVLGQNKKS